MRRISALILLALALAVLPARGDQNLVEPLSNGLQLSMTMAQIQEKFGKPTETAWDPGTFGYKDFLVLCGGSKGIIWRVQLRGDVKLSSGIGPGSSRADVKRVLGSEFRAVSGQYQLTINYDAAGRASEVIIEPANGPFAAMDAPPAAGIPNLPALIGNWNASDHALDLFPDGTYKYGLLASGRWHVEKDEVVFDGALAAWNSGHGHAKDGRLEFVWTDATGPHTYAFIKQ
jgi:hypothetical protein